jgi:aminomethyltransferase
MSRTTPLHVEHLAAGARMVDFAGWSMPLHYGSQLDEHHAVRRAAGMFDVSHMLVVDLDGAGATDWLRRLVAGDCGRLADGHALYGCMLDDAGGVIDDLIVYRIDGARWRIVGNAARADADLAWLHAVHARDAAAGGSPAVAIRPRHDLALIAVQGPQARARLAQALPAAAATIGALEPFAARAAGTAFIARTGYTGEDGCEVMLPAAEAPALWERLARLEVARCGLGARDTLRLEAGMNLYGQDMDVQVSPLECGLAWTVAFDPPRDFIGRAALEAQRAAGPKRRRIGLLLLEPGVLRAGQTLATAHGTGLVTSGGYAPTLGCSVALARVPAAVRAGERVQVDIRGRPRSALAVQPPFVRNGTPLVTGEPS